MRRDSATTDAGVARAAAEFSRSANKDPPFVLLVMRRAKIGSAADGPGYYQRTKRLFEF
jgi:hypothetical protein